jgi:protein O-GlcNAc transferase
LPLAGLLVSGCPPPAEVRPDPGPTLKRRAAVEKYNQGIRLLSSKRGTSFYEAVTAFEEAAGLDPGLYEAHYNLGVLYDRGNDYPRAKAAFRAALAARLDDRATLLNLASAARKAGRLGEAVDLLMGILKTRPDDFEARHSLAVLYRLQGDHARAIEQARWVLDRDPGQVLAYNNLATIFSEAGRHEMAEDLFRRALALAPDDPRVLNNLGLARLRSAHVQEALDMFLRAARAEPPLPEAALNAAAVYMQTADYARAAEVYQRLGQRVPGFLPAQVGLAVAQRGLGRIEEAERSYQRVLGLDPSHPEAMFNLGLLYLNHRSRPDWACEALQRLLGSGRADERLAGRARGLLEDIRLQHPGACQAGSQKKPGGAS